MKFATYSLALLFSLAFGLAAEEAEDDPTEPRAGLVTWDCQDQPLNTQAPLSQFTVAPGDEVWEHAWARATQPLQNKGSGYLDLGQLLGEGFRSAKNFRAEQYLDNTDKRELQLVIEADEAVRKEQNICLTCMRITNYMKTPACEEQAGAKKKGAGEKEKEKEKDTPAEKKPSAFTDNLPPGSYMLISAPQAIIDTNTNEGHARGEVTIEIFAKEGADQLKKPMAILKTERLCWRTWSEAAIGSTEFVMRTYTDKPEEPEPKATGWYIENQPDGTTSTMQIEGLGFIYESGSYERPTRVYDDDFRTAGLSTVARSRALFHRDIRIETISAVMNSLVPLQGPAKEPDKKAGSKKQPAQPSRTVITCRGPAIFNMAAVPHVKRSLATEDSMAQAEDSAALKIIELERRYEFLNNVKLHKAPLEQKPAEDTEHSDMACLHLCLQYPPGSLPSFSSSPEYGEAIGGVFMRGARLYQNPARPDLKPQLTPFDCECQRVFYDCPNDNMFLVGTPQKPARVKNGPNTALAQQFNYRQRNEIFTMPSAGEKTMVLHTDPPPPPPASGPPAAQTGLAGGLSGDTTIHWKGIFSREIKRMPVPKKADLLKEVLVFLDDVRIEQPPVRPPQGGPPQGGLNMRGARIQLTRALPTEDLEYVEGEGAVNVKMGDLQAIGEYFSDAILLDQNGSTGKSLVTVVGSRKNETKAMLFQTGSAMRSDKFVIEMVDGAAHDFESFGGAVAVFKATPSAAPQAPKPQAAQDAGGLFKGLSVQPGGDTFIQCDGEFSQDGAAHKVTIKKNVLIRQPGLVLLTDEAYLTLANPPAPQPSQPNAPAASDAASATNALFSFNLKSILCLGNVEKTSPDQLVQCDRLFHDADADFTFLDMDDAENDVRIYNLLADTGKTRFISAEKSLKVDGKTGLFHPGGMLLMLPYRDNRPVPRDKNSSPALEVRKWLASKGGVPR